MNKLEAIEEIYKICYGNTSFAEIGSDLAYTTLAILTDMKVELNPFSQFVRLLKKEFPSHMVWGYVKIEPTVLCINCETEILWDQASFCPPLNGWLGHFCCIDSSNNCYAEITLT